MKNLSKEQLEAVIYHLEYAAIDYRVMARDALSNRMDRRIAAAWEKDAHELDILLTYLKAE